MKSTWPLDERRSYESVREVDSASIPGVKFRVRRMSFGRRLELARRIRELDKRLEYAQAGEDVRSQVEAAITAGEIDRVYLEWGLEGVEGLQIDGEPATPEALVERGPEELAREVLEAIRRECFLSEDERKN